MPYIVKMVLITDKQHSVDGKNHRNTLYYQGINEVPFKTVVFDKGKKTAVVFKSKSEAQRFARRYQAEVVKI